MLKEGHIGVHPPGALGVSLFAHTKAECFVGCAGDGITDPLRQIGHLMLDDGGAMGQVSLAGRVYCNLLEADVHGATPELLLVCCNPGQLRTFTADLTRFIANHAERGHMRSVDDVRSRIPIMLVLPNGIVAEEMLENFRAQLTEHQLMDKLPGVTEAMLEAMLERVVRGVSMQAGGRRGSGAETVYILERRGLVLVAAGEDPAGTPGERCCRILEAHDYTAKLIPRSAVRVEFDKAMISIVLNVGGLIHMVTPEGDLTDLRMGDLCLDETKADFVDRITRAVFDVGKASGAYGEKDTFDEVWAGHRETILAHAKHVTSSVKAFRDAVNGGMTSVSLMTNEEWILTPLQRYATQAGLTAELDLFRSLARQVQEAMARAIKRRLDPIPRNPLSPKAGAKAGAARGNGSPNGARNMKLTAQRNISIELFEAHGGEDLVLVGTMLDNDHLIKLEMTIHLGDEQITRSRLDMIRAPFHVCRQVEGCAEALVGLRIQRGVLNEIAKRVGGRIGCSHLKELATNIVYFAASYLARRRAGLEVVGVDSAHIPTEEKFRLTRSFLNGSCLAYCQTSPLALDEQMGIRRLGVIHESPIPLGECEPSLGVVLRDRAKKFGEKTYLRWRGQAVHPDTCSLTFHDFARRVFQISRHLIASDIRKGDRIAMISENRAEMLMFEMAAMSIGAVSVPVYAGYPPPQINYVLRHARPRMGVISGMHQLAKIEGGSAERYPWIEHWYCMDADDATRAWGALDFASLCEPGASGGAMSEELESRIDAVRADDLALIMYTSGTTGPPKGVMLTHRNLISQQKAMSLLAAGAAGAGGAGGAGGWDVSERDVFLSYLPWHHSFGGLYERFMTLYNGCELCLDDSMGRDVDRLLENWRLFKPTLFFSVPRVHDMLLARCREDAEANETIFGGSAGGGLRFVFTAGASLPAPVAEQYARHNIPVREGWGLTETSPCCTVTVPPSLAGAPPASWRSGYVGWPIPGVTIRIDSDQEILVRGPNVMRGYLDDEEMTSRVIDEDGWFHTGDLGEYSQEEGLRILGRRDGAFKLTTGEKVHPHRIENVLMNESPYISTALALGTGRDFVAALVFPDRARLRDWAARQGIDRPEIDSLLEHPSVRDLYAAEISRVNPMIEVKYHRIKRFVLIGRDLSLDRGEVTPSGKVCRDRVCEGCRREIEMLFEPAPGEAVIAIADPGRDRAGARPAFARTAT